MRKIMLLLAALALPLAACGDDEPDSAAGDSGDAPVQLDGTVNDEGRGEAADGDTLEMELDSFYFGPTFVQTDPGATITLTLTNESEDPHTFTIDSLQIDEELQAGDSVDVDVTLPDSGATAFYCRFHEASGMQGAFYFQEGDTVQSGISGITGVPDTTSDTTSGSDGY